MTLTTAQSRGAFLKSTPDILRNEKQVHGELKWLPLLTWFIFLKFLGNLDFQRPLD